MNQAPLERLARWLRQMLERLRHDAAGQSVVEYLIVIGACALVGIFGLTQYARALRSDLASDAKHIEGEGLPSTEGILSLVGADYNELPGWCVQPTYCFGAGTPVQTETGDRPIESIRAGDRVWARDVDTGEIALRTVSNTYRTPGVPVLELALQSGFASPERIAVTAGHLFWVEGAGWLRADALSAKPLWSTESALSAAVSDLGRPPSTVYNLEVEGFHSYFVGHAHVLVHNGAPNDGVPCVELPPPATTGSASPEEPDRSFVVCGESGQYRWELGGGTARFKDKTSRPTGGAHRDHVPSGQALEVRAKRLVDEWAEQEMEARCRLLSEPEMADLRKKVQALTAEAKEGMGTLAREDGFTINLPAEFHKQTRTYGDSTLPARDSQDLQRAAQLDIARYEQLLGLNGNTPTYQGTDIDDACKQRIIEALAKIRNKTDQQYETELRQSVTKRMEELGFSRTLDDECPDNETASN